MKIQHYLVLALIFIGGLYVFHMWNTHGTVKGGLQGLGINRYQ